MDYKELKEVAKGLDINPFGKKKDVLEQLVMEAQNKKEAELLQKVDVKIAEEVKPVEEVDAVEVANKDEVVIEGEIFKLSEKGNPVPNFKLTAANDYSYQREATRLKLAVEEKVPFYVPLESFEKQGDIETVEINGWAYYLPKNEQHMIPMSIYKVLQKKLKMRDSTVIPSEKNISQDENKQRALN